MIYLSSQLDQFQPDYLPYEVPLHDSSAEFCWITFQLLSLKVIIAFRLNT